MRLSRGAQPGAPSPQPRCEGVMTQRRTTACGIAAGLGLWIVTSVMSLSGQSAAPLPQPRPALGSALQAAVQTAPRPAPAVEAQRALLDRYCVACHSDRVKTANLSLQGLDLTRVADQAELWE